MRLRRWLVQQVVDFMTRPLAHYERRGWTDVEALERRLCKGDVLLVEGNQRISAVIRYVTQSSWSHSALYVGDELLRRGEHLRAEALALFGDDARHMLIEALLEGVVASPVSKYRYLNLRVCRPRDLKPHDLERILDDAVRSLGWRYDVRNILDLLRYLFPVSLVPSRFRRAFHQAGSGMPTAAICSSHIGRLFQEVGFPVAPLVERREVEAPKPPPRRGVRAFLSRERTPHDAILFRRRHPSLLTPRDFDLSPYFEVVKAGPGMERFDYTRIRWLDPEV